MLQRRSSPQPASQFGKKHLWQTAVDGAFRRALYWHFPRYLWLGLQPSADLWPSKCHIAACSYAKRVVWHVVCEKTAAHERYFCGQSETLIAKNTNANKPWEELINIANILAAVKIADYCYYYYYYGGEGWHFDITCLLAPRLTYGSSTLQKVRCVSSTNSWTSREATECRRMSGKFILTPMFFRLASSASRCAWYWGQINRKWATVSGILHTSHKPSGWSPNKKRWRCNFQWPILNRNNVAVSSWTSRKSSFRRRG